MIELASAIPRTLNALNINQAIIDYLGLLKNIPLTIEADNLLQLMLDIKRKKLELGPYPNVSMFESANRIMSDLTILYGVKELLNGVINGIDFKEYTVELGHENINSHDIEADDGKQKLYGEGFNVAESYFPTKKGNSLKKLRRKEGKNVKLLLVYNNDAVKERYTPKTRLNEYHLKVKIDFQLLKNSLDGSI